jgi:DNA processing protein
MLTCQQEQAMDDQTALTLAVAGSRHTGGPMRMAARLRAEGPDYLVKILDGLNLATQAQVRLESEHLFASGVRVALMGTRLYPRLLGEVQGAPPLLFFSGPRELLSTVGLAVCGSRNASDIGLQAARACGHVAASMGLTVISGYARGVDMATHTAALESGGRTVIVLAEGIHHFRVKRGHFSRVWDPDRVLVVSQFSPTQPWSAGQAMTRNVVILGLGRALVVVEAAERGGTYAAGMRALKAGRRVLALEFARAPKGNDLLLKRGAIPVRSAEELSRLLKEIPATSQGQLSIL